MTGPPTSINRLAAQATTHCLTGCAAGEVLGVIIGGAVGLSTLASLVVGIGLAYVFGYALTMRPLLAGGLPFGRATRLALASDTVSITVMELTDNVIVLLIPGVMAAGLSDPIFWVTLVVGLGIGWLVAFPVNRWLIARGQGHAVVHDMHHDDHGSPTA